MQKNATPVINNQDQLSGACSAATLASMVMEAAEVMLILGSARRQIPKRMRGFIGGCDAYRMQYSDARYT